MTAPSGQHNPPDGRSAHQARLAFAAIDSMLKLKKSFLAVGIDIIGNRRSAERDGLAQHFPHRSMQFGQLLPRDGGRAAARTDAGPKQRFVGINVAHAAQQLLIQQRTLDGSLAAAKSAMNCSSLTSNGSTPPGSKPPDSG